MEPHYFGSSDRQLLGIYHSPRGRARSHGVVLCPPGPQEYMRTHMVFRQLAVMLARDGFHVLRFDYYGTGDSSGGSRDGNLGEWRQNIVTAAKDLKECSGVTKVSLIGLRLGATLAALTPLHVSNLVLWEPVVNGKTYLDELSEIHTRKFSNLLYPPRLPVRGRGGELLGFALPPEMEADIEVLDLLSGISCRAEQVVLMVSEERPEYLSLQGRLREAASSGGAAVAYHRVRDESQSEHDQAMILPTQALQLMTAALSERAG
jgi:pimeloyl-ACP methyl ester carboxylesterase